MKNQRFILLIPLMLVLFISALDQTVVASSLSSIADAMGNTDQITWLTTAYLITSAVTTLIFGKLGDVLGQKSMLIVSLSIFLIGSLACGNASQLWVLVLSRAFQGIGGGGLSTLCMSVIGNLFSPRERSRYQGWIGIVPALALVCGPFIGGFITDQLSWHWIFFINLPIGILALVLIGVVLHLPKSSTKAKIDFLGALTISISTASLLLNLSLAGHQWAFNSIQSFFLFTVFAVTLVSFILIERRALAPIVPLHFFKSNPFTIAVIQFFIVTAAMFVFMLLVPMYFQMDQGYSASAAGSTVIPLMLGVILSSAVLGEWITRTGKYKRYPAIGAVLIGGSAIMMSTLTSHSSVVVVALALFISGAGQGAIIQVALVAGQNAVSFDNIGAVTGALNFFKSLGGSFGSVIFSGLLADFARKNLHATPLAQNFGHTFLALIPLMLISFCLALLMKEKPLSDQMIKVAKGQEEVPEY